MKTEDAAKIFDVPNPNVSFRHDCEKSQCMALQSPDFQTMFGDCFGGKCRPGDTDCEVYIEDDLVIIKPSNHRNALVERKGHFFLMESKRTGAALGWAQEKVLKERAKRGDTVMVLWHNKPDGSDINQIRTWNCRGYTDGVSIPADLSVARAVCRTWWEFADKGLVAA